MEVKWADGFTIEVKNEGGAFVLSANKEGLLSLAKQFGMLAEAEPGSHIHYDEHNCLEAGSADMIVEKKR